MLRKMVKEVVREDLYRGRPEEAGQADTRGGSDIYLTSFEGHVKVDE